jgi:hypothetical protein
MKNLVFKMQKIFRVTEFYVTELIIIFEASCATQPAVKSHRLINTGITFMLCTSSIKYL